ncbi:Tetratricopeptide repeat-containing protein [Spirosomataceae bacterium TFI 002]|nr:Tetratricopeptide repeat-containing protein [Spirosomataceae bacterium TFI 002]
MILRLSILLFLINLPFVGIGQVSMSSGFKMLEEGQFSEAAKFFEGVLEKEPNNQTAMLCYGRGIGLSGNTDEAKKVFKKLQELKPGDYEVDLNMAESFMWSKDYKVALDLYKDLYERNPKSFPAVLGMANAFSENKKYDEALTYIEQALEIDPKNANAKVSRKFMRLGKGAQLMNSGNYEGAILLHNLILKEDSLDTDGLLNRATALIASKQYELAKKDYNKLLSIPDKEVESYLGLSRIANLEKDKKASLQIAKEAVFTADSAGSINANMGLVNAYGALKDFKSAFNIIDSLWAIYPNDPNLISAYGRMNIWSKGFKKATTYYNDLLELKPDSFDGNLGYADAHHAMALDKTAFEYVRNTLGYYPGQIDALNFLERLHLSHDPSISSHVFSSLDNGGNVSTNYNFVGTFDPHPNWRTYLSYYSRKAENKIDGVDNVEVEKVDNYGAGVSYQLNGWLRVGGKYHFLFSQNYKRKLGEINAALRVGKFQNIELLYKEEVQNFNADLIKRNLKLSNYQVNYNLSLPSRIGLYSQLIHTQVSDGNQRNLAFVSLYYDILTVPSLKAGFNYSIFGFQQQVPEVYFSPDVFKGYELFVASENVNLPNAKWIYQATFATGVQQISNEDSQGIYRFDVKAGRKFGSRFYLMGYFMKSNSAASSVQGFTYNEWGIRTRWAIPLRNL